MAFGAGNLLNVTSEDLVRRRQSGVRGSTIDYVADSLSYGDFFHRFLVPNEPCVFSPKSTETWLSRKEWVTGNGKPDFEILGKTFGAAAVPVADCEQEKFKSHPKIEMNFRDYTQYWQNYISNGYPKSEKCLYLKDWHFKRAFPNYKAYETPIYFQSDWLNEFWDSRDDDDYRFVYMGPKGSWTPLHADVFHSYSWSANVCGKKQWIIFPPGEEDCLKDNLGQLAFDVTLPELQDNVRYPQYQRLKHCYKIIQEPGEIIFVPSGWYHQVINMEDTISINHNWCNGCNIDICWKYLKNCLKDVEKEIADCQDMEGWNEQCQVILKCSSGINFKEFLDFLELIASNRLNSLKAMPDPFVTEETPSESNHEKQVCGSESQNSVEDRKLSEKMLWHYHTHFDMEQLRHILQEVKRTSEVSSHLNSILEKLKLA